MMKLKNMNIAHRGSAIPSAIGILFRNILEPSSGGTGSILKDPSPALRKNPNLAMVERKPVETENRIARKPMAKARLMPGPAAEIIILSSSGSLFPRRLESFP